MKRFVSVLMFAFVCGCMMSAVADTYILNDSNTTVNNPTIADNGSTNAIVSSSASGKITYTMGTMTIVGDSTINNTNRLQLQAAIVSDGQYTITKTNSGQLLFENDSSAVGKIVINGSGQVVAQTNANSINAINGVDLNTGQLQIWNLQNVTGTIYANGGSIQSAGGTNSFIGDIVLNAALNINVNTATFTTTGSITSTSNKMITKSGAGTWEIKGSPKKAD